MSQNVQMASSSSDPLHSSEDSLPKRIYKLEFTVNPPKEATTEEVRKCIFPIFRRRNAIKMQVCQDGMKMRVKVFFTQKRDPIFAQQNVSKSRMQEHLEQLKEELAKKECEQAPLKNIFLGPNGQAQKRKHYKPGQCPYGCGSMVQPSIMEFHRESCTAIAAYENEQREYMACEERLAERPSAFVMYEDSVDFENMYGFLYGYGPFKLHKK